MNTNNQSLNTDNLYSNTVSQLARILLLMPSGGSVTREIQPLTSSDLSKAVFLIERCIEHDPVVILGLSQYDLQNKRI